MLTGFPVRYSLSYHNGYIYIDMYQYISKCQSRGDVVTFLSM